MNSCVRMLHGDVQVAQHANIAIGLLDCSLIFVGMSLSVAQSFSDSMGREEGNGEKAA